MDARVHRTHIAQHRPPFPPLGFGTSALAEQLGDVPRSHGWRFVLIVVRMVQARSGLNEGVVVQVVSGFFFGVEGHG